MLYVFCGFSGGKLGFLNGDDLWGLLGVRD